MKWFLIVAAVLVALVLLMALVGTLLPQDHVATRSARYLKTPAEVFAVISDVEGFGAWRKDVKKVEVISPTSWRENGELTLEIIEQSAPTRLVTRIAPGLAFGGTWTYELSPDGDGVKLTITERGEVYNPIFRFMSRFVFGHSATLDGYLAQLGAKFAN